MYRRSSQSRPPILFLFVAALVAGIIFVIVDNPPAPGAPALPIGTTAAIMPTLTNTSPPTATATADPEQESRAYISPDISADARLMIPTAGINARIVQAFLDGISWDVSRLGPNVGHLQGTALPGEPGNVVLSGHVELSDGRGGVFSRLNDVSVDDLIMVQVDGREWVYVVTEIGRTAPDDITPVMPDGTDRLTLITCDSYDFLSDSYLERVIVVATLVQAPDEA